MRSPRSNAQLIEVFHLVFLGVMQARVDPSRYVLKGGANLRYFFNSDRYSEDIDLDAIDIPAWNLESKIDSVFASSAMVMQLARADMAIDELTKPKQTDTTQRWKLSLVVDGLRSPVRTKVEFNHRARDERRTLESVPARVTKPYALRPPSVLHYQWAPALEQKIAALAKRPETQARDVFDLELLLRQGPMTDMPDVSTEHVQAAILQASELPFQAFEDQVLPFLDPDLSPLYDRQSWDAIRGAVVQGLGGLT